MGEVILTVAGGAAAALLGAAATVWLEERRTRRDAKRRALAVVKAVRENIRASTVAAEWNEMALQAEMKAISTGSGWNLMPLRPVRMPALDLLQAQYFEDLPTDVVVQASDLAGLRDMATDAHRARDAFRASNAALSTFTLLLSMHDSTVAGEYKLLRENGEILDRRLAEVETQLARPSKFRQYYDEAGRLEP
jgi:hypothetical protein